MRPPSRPGGPRARLGSGAAIPLLGLGTWELPRGMEAVAVGAALQAGLRHLDCASVYGNQAEVGRALGRALAAGEVARQDLFVTSKLWPADVAAGRVREACLSSLRALQLDRLDLYLMHWPPSGGDSKLLEAWRQMEELVEDGLATSIGVSNFSRRRLALLLDSPDVRVPPAVNQVEAHPGWRNQKLLDFCKQRAVHMTAYSPLGRGGALGPEAASLLTSPEVQEAASCWGCSPAQALLRWALSRGTSAVFKSSSPENIAANAAVILEGNCAGPACMVPAKELGAAAAGLLDRLPQARRVTGAALVGPGQKHLFSSLAELWEEEGRTE
mmetsp:Transcript_18611/g.52027  ORF Transcript_18611/g.52027 Transcript_18611/m.52027 type:complete len:328 (+) Transcript_18611:1-984(+)